MVVAQSIPSSKDHHSFSGVSVNFSQLKSSDLPNKSLVRMNLNGNGNSNEYTKIRFNSAEQARSFGNVNPNIPIITSFAMKEDGTSPGVSGEDGSTLNQVLSPKDIDELFTYLKSEEFSTVRYSAYRTAMKLNALQKGLCLDIVRLGTVVGVFHQHGLGLPLGPVISRGATPNLTNGNFKSCLQNNHDDVIIEKQKAADIISGIFFSAGKGRTYYQPTLDVLACTEAVLSTAMAIYGVQHRTMDYQCISTKALKVFCVMLCEGRLIDRFSYLYQEFSSGKAKNMKFLTRRSLSGLLRLICKLSTFLGEAQQFGLYLVDAAVSQCFQGGYQSLSVINDKSDVPKNQNDDFGITEEIFMAWILKEPQVVVWVATFYRLVSAQNIHHGVLCVGCKKPNIKGLRYQCLRCLNYDLCQDCFFHGVSNRYHKLWHPMQEYCNRGTRKDATKALLKLISNHLSLKKRREEKKKRRNAKQLQSNKCKELKENKNIMKHTKNSHGQRYLPHDPRLETEGSTSGNTKKTESSTMDSKQPEDNVDRKNTECNLLRNERENLALEDFETTTILRQEGNAIIATDHSINTTKSGKHGKEVLGNMKHNESHDQQAKLFNSIVVHLEEQNYQIMKKLQSLQGNPSSANTTHQGRTFNENNLLMSQQQPLESCQSMHTQLQRLKGLVDNIFGDKSSSPTENVVTKQGLPDSIIPHKQYDDTCGAIEARSIDGTPNQNEATNDNIKMRAILPIGRVESTPLCDRGNRNNKFDDNGQTSNFLSRSAIHHEFSPILLNDVQGKRGRRLELETVQETSISRHPIYEDKTTSKCTSPLFAPESFAVDKILNGDNENTIKLQLCNETDLRSFGTNHQISNETDFSRMSLHELTSLLVKTGKIVPSFDLDHSSGNEISNPYNVTRILDPKHSRGTLNSSNAGVEGTKMEIMEELESLMLRLENVFEAYHSPKKGSATKDVDQLKRISSVHLQQLQKEQDPMIIGQIVSEIVDQIHSFNYRCLGNTKTQSQPSSSPSISRSEGDGLSSPEPPVLSHSVRAQCTS